MPHGRFRRLNIAALVTGALVASLISGPALAKQCNLTGKWKGNDGATYYIRQINQVVWWYGENSKTRPAFSNVAFGTLKGNVLDLLWADVPKGRILQDGGLTIRVKSCKSLRSILNTGGFGGIRWTKTR